jgi:hypothetical protein
MEFKSADEFREVMDRVFELMSTDPDMGPKLRDAEAPQRYVFPDLGAVVNVNAAAGDAPGSPCLVWEWSDDVAWDAEVVMEMDSDIANRYFQGKENVAMAIARRRIKTSGNATKALSLLPITKPVFARYRALIEEEYPHLVEV